MAESAEALETIDLLYQAAIDPALWPEALHRLALATGGFGTAMIPITPGSTAGLLLSPELLESRADYDREWYQHDTRVGRIHSRKLSDGVWCESQLFTEEEIANDPMRQEFCRAYGMGSFAAQLVSPLPNFVVAFSVMRAVEQGEFAKRELETLDLLGRHAARALVISTQLAVARGFERGLAAVLSGFECAAFLVDNACTVLFANEAAETLLGDGLTIRRGALEASSKGHRAGFARLLQSVLRRDANARAIEPIALPRPSGRRPLIVQAMPIAPDGAEFGFPVGAAALLIVVDPERGREANVERELCLLGLTASEARLAALIGRGLSRGESAEALGLSPATVSDTVKHIYSKLDIKRQSELVRLVDRLGVLAARRKENSEA
jgi:DNA-binding CsgD family transcriptional regulator